MAMTVHSLPDPLRLAEQQRTRAGRLRMLLVVAVCAAPVIASYFSFYVLNLRGSAYSDLITPTVDMPATLQFSDLAGRPVAGESLKGQWLLTLVQDEACNSECDRRLFTQRQLREMLGKERDKLDKVLLLSGDTPLAPELQALLAQTPAVTVLRLPADQLQAWLKPAAEHALREHFYLIDPMGRWMMRSPAVPDPSRLKRDLDRLLKANAGWDKPGR